MAGSSEILWGSLILFFPRSCSDKALVLLDLGVGAGSVDLPKACSLHFLGEVISVDRRKRVEDPHHTTHTNKHTLLRVIPTMTFQSCLDAIVKSMLPWS